LGKDKSFVNSLGRIISAFQTGSGQIKRYTQTLLNTGAITAETAIEIKSLSAEGGSAADVVALLTKEFKKSEQAAREFALSVEGLQSTLSSRFGITLAGVAGEKGLANYKLLLQEVNSILLGIRETKAFKVLGNEMEGLNAEIFDLVQSDEFKQFLLDITALAAVLARVLTGVIASIKVLRNMPGLGDAFNVVGALSRASGPDEIAKLNNAAERERLKALKETAKNTGDSADTLNPERDGGK